MDVQQTLRLRSRRRSRTPNAARIMAQPVEIVMTSIGGGGNVGPSLARRTPRENFSDTMDRAPELTKGRGALDQCIAQRFL